MSVRQLASSEADDGGEVIHGADWRRHWYPLGFVCDLEADLHRITVHDEGFALFRAGGGAWSAVVDRCPHRSARLSDGEVVDGVLHCLYHGWEFDGGGRCLRIPQLLSSVKIPARAHVEAVAVREAQGMVWLRPMTSGEPGPVPLVRALDRPDVKSVDFAIELPYEQSFLIENVIDIAHIHVAHHGVRGGGHRDLAAPITFDLSEMTAEGFSAAFQSIDLEIDSGQTPLRGAMVRFFAPNLVHYESIYEDPELVSGLALYSLPAGRNRCRLFYRAYTNFPRLRDRLRPRWLEHWTQCTILEQDMDVVLGQVEEILSSGKPPRRLWLPLKTSDALVVAYRKWLDRFAPTETVRVGFDRVADTGSGGSSLGKFDRFRMHTELCSSCSQAHGALLRARGPLAMLTVAALALAAATAGSVLAATVAGVAVGLAACRHLVDRLERRFR